MKVKASLAFFTVVVSLPFFSYCQNIEKIIFDTKDTTNGHYLVVEPLSKQSKGVLVILTSFLPPESLLPETKLHSVAYTNDILTIVASTKQKLYADSTTVNRIEHILKDVVKRFSVDPSKFVLAGYDEAGNIALRYTELTYEMPSQFSIQPKASSELMLTLTYLVSGIGRKDKSKRITGKDRWAILNIISIP